MTYDFSVFLWRTYRDNGRHASFSPLMNGGAGDNYYNHLRVWAGGRAYLKTLSQIVVLRRWGRIQHKCKRPGPHNVFEAMKPV